MNKNTGNTAPEEKSMVHAESLTRRAILRGTLLAGCCLLAPITLLSACSKEADPAAPALPEKLPKEKVKYQLQPNGAQKCSNCMNFNSATKTCQRVEGSISPEGWCVLWARNA